MGTHLIPQIDADLSAKLDGSESAEASLPSEAVGSFDPGDDRQP
jgi:hypothetical protein